MPHLLQHGVNVILDCLRRQITRHAAHAHHPAHPVRPHTHIFVCVLPAAERWLGICDPEVMSAPSNRTASRRITVEKSTQVQAIIVVRRRVDVAPKTTKMLPRCINVAIWPSAERFLELAWCCSRIHALLSPLGPGNWYHQAVQTLNQKRSATATSPFIRSRIATGEDHDLALLTRKARRSSASPRGRMTRLNSDNCTGGRSHMRARRVSVTDVNVCGEACWKRENRCV